MVRCQTNLGRVVDEFNAQCEGDEVEIGFNNRYLLDALRNARTEQVRMEISGPLSPVKVLPVDGSDFLGVTAVLNTWNFNQNFKTGGCHLTVTVQWLQH